MHFQASAMLQQQQQQHTVKLEIDYDKIPPLPPLPPALPPEDPHFPPDKTRIPELQGTFDWMSKVNDKCFMAAPVSNFQHVSACF